MLEHSTSTVAVGKANQMQSYEELTRYPALNGLGEHILPH